MTAIVVFRARVRPGVDEAYAAAGARDWFEITVATSVRQYEWTRADA